MKNYQLKLGFALSALLSVVVLPLRLAEGQGKDPFNLIGSEIVICAMCFVCWVSIIFSQKVGMLATWQQIILAIFLNISASIFFYYSFVNFFEDYPLNPIKDDPLDLGIFRLAIRGILVSLVLLPFAYYVEKQREVQKAKMENERLKRENLQAHFNFLQQKMNPHFMFNSLNVLRSGLQDEWARNYVVQLSHVYRYLLYDTNAGGQVSLQRELAFVKSYIHILKERFEDGFYVNIAITDEVLDNFGLLSMSLQTLIENAVKHNIVAQRQPLIIAIYDEGQFIVVKNNLQLKPVNNFSAPGGLGLANLNERYRLLDGSAIVVQEGSGHFAVRIPLLELG